MKKDRLTIMFVFGTRPEAIKLAPLILKAKEEKYKFNPIVVVTAQHRQMLDEVLSAYKIIPDIDLNVMDHGQSLFYITSKVIKEMEIVLNKFQPDVLIVQGDTTTSFAAALCGFYAKIKVAHVEAGLRTYKKWAPFPEEINRRLTSVLADYNFTPTESAKKNLLKDGYNPSNIYVTGNTVIDALMWMIEHIKDTPCPVPEISHIFERYSKVVLITGHRRENFGEPFKNICAAFYSLSCQNPDIAFIYPVHLNPNVQKSVRDILSNISNFFLVPPIAYPQFCWVMKHCYIIITDSGGIQEEAPALGKPVLVTRKVTERPEAVDMGMVKLVGDTKEVIIEYANKLLYDKDFYNSMSLGFSPYGDGKASDRILNILANE